MKIKLLAGQETSVSTVGRHFRVLTAVQTINVRIIDSVTSRQYYRGELASGIGIDFSDKTEYTNPYDRVFLYSDIDQTIELWSEIAPVSDDRLSGNFDINAALTVAQTSPKNHESKTISVSDSGVEVLPERASRKTALIQVDAPVYVHSLDGVLAESSFTWTNQSALTLFAQSGTVTARINEDY